MSTRSNIIIKNKDNTYTYIYLHYDGYIFQGVGESLLKNISRQKQVEKLIKHGSRKSLYAKESYKDMESSYTVNTLDEVLEDGYPMIEYYYLFEDNSWKVACRETDNLFVDLREYFLANISSYLDDRIDRHTDEVLFNDD